VSSGLKTLRLLYGVTISSVGLLLLVRAEEKVPRDVKERRTTIAGAPGAVRAGQPIVIPEGGAGVRSQAGIGIGIEMTKGAGVQAQLPGLLLEDPVRPSMNPKIGKETETETEPRLPPTIIEQNSRRLYVSLTSPA